MINLNSKFISKSIIALIGIFLIFFIPRVISLGSDMANIDTMYWYPRMEKFPRKLLQGDFKGTYQQYHPGTTVLWASGFSKYYFEKAFEWKFKYNPAYIPHQFTKIQFASTFPIVFLISILGTICYWIIKRLESNKLATIFVILLSLEPFFLGVSKFLHLTALSTMFGFTGFLFFILFLKTYTKKWLVFAGILEGLALATKISVLIYQPIIGLVALLYMYSFSAKFKGNFIQLVKIFKVLATQFLVATGVFIFVNPFMWTNPIWGINKIINGGIVNTGFGGGMPDTLLNSQYLYYLETAFVRTSPIVFLCFIFGIFMYFRNFRKMNKNILISSSILLFVIYYLFLSVPSKLKDRYFVELMPPMILISSYFISIIFEKVGRHKQIILSGIYLAYMAVIFYSYHPAYSFYHTELIGGPNGLQSRGIRPTNRGEWYAQAAQFLNTQDNVPEEKNVLIGNESLVKTFAPFYYGTTYAELGAIPDNKGHKVHYIVTRNDNQKYVPTDKCPLIKTFGNKGPFSFDNVFVFKCNNIAKEELSKLIPTFPDY